MPLLRRKSSDKDQQRMNESENQEHSSLFRRLSNRARKASASESLPDKSTSSEHKTTITDPPVTTHPHDREVEDTAVKVAGAEKTSTHIQSHAAPSTYSSKSKEDSGALSGHESDALVKGGLTVDDVHHLFHGAPHFMLEKGRRNRYFPQAFFPWNNDLDVSDLADRRYLKHESFALATLHSHLPIPDEVNWKPGMEHPLPKEGLDTGKRPMFDLGIYEVPNMLSLEGRLPGTVGMRWFLERSVADEVIETTQHGPLSDQELEHIPANVAFKSLIQEEGLGKIGKHAPVQDRGKLIKGGPELWKRIGVRDISVSALTARLEHIGKVRDELVKEGWRVTILNKMTCDELGKHLFEEMLYPPPTKMKHVSKGDELKIQVEALVKVLTTPGAWLDFSKPATRFKLGKILHSRDETDAKAHGIYPGAERRWTLIQLALAVELVIRIDAALRLGVAQHIPDYQIDNAEIHHFNKLRNLKIDWDFVVARKFLTLCFVKKLDNIRPDIVQGESGNHQSEPHLLESIKQKFSHHEIGDIEDAWECVLLPRQPQVMIDGLIRFATNIGWLRTLEVKKSILEKCGASSIQRECLLSGLTIHGRPIRPEPYKMMHKDATQLRPGTKDTTGGPISSTWLSGLIIPGFSCSEIIMATLLENDPVALSKLGSSAFLRGGFILEGKSWWNKVSVVGRTMAPIDGFIESMGWIGLPSIVPVDKNGEIFSDSWVNVVADHVPKLREGQRIFDGTALATESSPLGIGHGKVQSGEFNMVTDEQVLADIAPYEIHGKINLILTRKQSMSSAENRDFQASINFNSKKDRERITLDLRYLALYVCAFPCRPPHGHITFSDSSRHGEASHPQHQSSEHLPAHPLHNSYKFVVKSVQDLLTSQPPNNVDKSTPVWIIDARAGSFADVVTRAWCSQVGRHALIAQVGMSCLSCAIREAKALQIGIIVRTGALKA